MGICGSTPRGSDPGGVATPSEEWKAPHKACRASTLPVPRDTSSVMRVHSSVTKTGVDCPIPRLQTLQHHVVAAVGDSMRQKQAGKRVAIAAEAASNKQDLHIPDCPKSDADFKMIGAQGSMCSMVAPESIFILCTASDANDSHLVRTPTGHPD